MKKLVIILLSMVFLCSLAFSQTLLETQLSGSLGSGARALGMGGAFIAVADDATATGWNPGGLGQIENIEISAVGSYYVFHRLEPSINMQDLNISTKYHTGDSWTFDFFSVSVPVRPFKDSDFKMVVQYSYQRSINLNFESNTNAISFSNLQREFNGYIPIFYLEQGYRYESDKYTGGLDNHSLSIGAKITSWANLGFTVNFWGNGYDGGRFIEESFQVGE